MSNDRKSKLIPAPRAILIALVAGALAGAVAVYVREGLSGNDAPVAVSPVETTAADTACEAKAQKAKTVAATAVGAVAAMSPADPPVSLASLAFNGPDGKPMSVGTRAGKTLLMNLWATWCAPCRAEMPSLDALQKEAGSDRFEVVAVNVDAGDDTKPKAFLSEIGIHSLGYYRESTLTLFNDLKKRGLALGLPVTLLIDPEGCLLAAMNGPAEWSGPDARRFLEAAIGKD